MTKMDQLQAELNLLINPSYISLEGSSLIIRPQTSEEVAAILRLANHTKTPVRPKGAGTGWWSSTQPIEGGILIQMNRMKRLLSIDEDVMAVTVQAGITFKNLEEELNPKGYRIMIFPESGKIASVGGHVQTWGTSPHTSAFFEDQATQILGLKVVLPTGDIVPIGTGAMTTAAGQFHRRFFPSDLAGLFFGSEGAFGVITEVTLKLYCQPEANIVQFFGFRDFETVLNTLRQIQRIQRSGGLLTLLEQRVVSKDMILAAIPRLKDCVPDDIKLLLVLRAEGNRIDVQNHIVAACDIGLNNEGKMIKDDIPEWWSGRYGTVPAAGLGKGHRVMIVAMVPFHLMLEAISVSNKFGTKFGLDLKLRGYPFGSPVFLAHASIPWEDSKPESREKALEQGRSIMEALIQIGCVPHRVGSDFLPVIAGYLSSEYVEFVKRIKKMLDPNEIMNPGVIIND